MSKPGSKANLFDKFNEYIVSQRDCPVTHLPFLIEPLMPTHPPHPSTRHKPPRPRQCPRGGVLHLGQRVLGGQLRRRLAADILSLVRPCVSHPSMLCFLLFSSSNALSVVTENVFFRVVFRTVVKAKTWKNTWMSRVCEFFLLPEKEKVATKLNMTQSPLSCCCYCFCCCLAGGKKMLYSLFLPYMLQP